jgi:hypothetical protein
MESSKLAKGRSTWLGESLARQAMIDRCPSLLDTVVLFLTLRSLPSFEGRRALEHDEHNGEVTKRRNVSSLLWARVVVCLELNYGMV